MCRVCRAPDNDDLITVQLVQEGVSVATMFLELTGIQVTADRNLPQNVCLACLERLRSAHLLRRQCLESDQLLRAELPVPAAKEVEVETVPKVSTPPPQLDAPTGMFKLEIETLEIESEPEEVVEEVENELKFIVESVDEVEEEDDQTIDILTAEEQPDGQVKQSDVMYLNSYDESDYEIVYQGEHYDRIKFIVARCCGCSRRFPNKTELLEHGQAVHKAHNQKPAKRNFPHECPVCFRQFTSKRAVGDHRDQIDTDWFHCRECDLLVHSQRQIVGHLERVHGITELEGESEEDGDEEDGAALTLAAFDPSQYELTRTEFGFDLVEFTCWRCCGCLASFELREDFEQHSREQHLPERREEDGDRPYECNICFRRFEKRASLMIHKNGPKKRRVVCRICEGIFRGETTYRKHAMKEHGMVNDGEDVGDVSMQDVEFIEEPLEEEGQVQEISDGEEDDDDEDDEDREVTGKYSKYNSSKQRKEMGRVPWNLLRTVEELDGYNVVEILKERCCNCLQFFDSVEELHEHTQVHRQEALAEAACSSKPIKYQCEFCLKSFDLALVYVVHKRIREQRQFYQCRLCDFVIDSESRLKNHMLHNDQHAKFFNLIREDVSDRYYAASLPGTRCCGCGQYFDGEDALEEHSRAMHPKDPAKESTKRTHSCRICGKRCYNRSDVLIHQKKNGSTMRYYCKLCDFETANEPRMLKHLYSSIHNEAFPAIEVKKIEIGYKKAGVIRYCCFEGCHLPFHDHQKLFDHVDELHLAQKVRNLDAVDQQTGNRLQCDCCHLHFRTLTLLKQHQSGHQRPLKSYVCSVCGLAKPSKAALATHELRHTGVRPYPCTVCDKRFSSTTILNSHMKCHAPKQYQCIECGEKFARSENLKRHIRHRHAEATFCCSYCPHKSKTREALNQHERSHTKEKPFECRSEGCQKRYASICDRRRHEMASHTGERPHQCDHCTASFVRKRQLTIHVRKHTGERPFVCLKCGKGFIDSALLKKHTC
ncbi:zinc finger protein [Culex quinquefasciatus]|uniref:Zinc finger protein n=1 Tax=Culex quinquefasciatus TaxID=7176 RepID=B0X5Z4_CULQU|nr:zinc finger protein [Culex quinquefasciatus]|eukprot:XP_001865066.1 zinc finger protein [Culex quinquefasciatus]